MESHITKEQIKFFKRIMNMAEPYPLEILDEIKYDDDNFDKIRISATMAKKILMENGIDIE